MEFISRVRQIFFLYFHENKAQVKVWNKNCLTSENQFHIECEKHWIFCFYIFFGSAAGFFQILDTAYNTWCVVTIDSHCENNTFDILHMQCEDNSLWKI